MFDTVRKHQRILQFVLMLLIVPSFAFFGISSYSSFLDKETDLVKINGKSITAQEVDNVVEPSTLRQVPPQAYSSANSTQVWV